MLLAFLKTEFNLIISFVEKEIYNYEIEKRK